MKTLFTTAIAAGFFLQQTAATDWGNAQKFSNPSNTNNVCTPEQKGGFNWGNLPTGNFNNFGGFDFSGFSCKDSFKPAKRSLNPRSNFQNKCIQGQISKNGGNAPKISGGDKDFSITEMQVSVSFDSDVDFLFSMPDGSTCKHTAFCSAGGSVVKNEQCGGAKSVTFQMPPRGSDKGCDIGIHSIGFDCQFASTPGTLTSTTTKSSPTNSIPVATTTTPVTTSQTTLQTTSSTTVATTPVTTPSTTAETTPQTTPSTSSADTPTTESKPEITPPQTTSDATQPPVTTTATSDLVTTEIVITTLTTCPITTTTTNGNLTLTKTTQTVSTTTLTSTATFCPKCGEKPPTTIETGIPPPPATTSEPPPTDVAPPPPPTSEVVPTSPPTPPPTDVITTEIVISTLTTCPVTLTTTSGSSTITSVTTTISTVVITSTSTVCTRCTAAPPSTLTASTPSNPSPPASSPPPPPPPTPEVPPVNNTPDLPCPEILPRCLNTWLPESCTSNSDTTCFCPSPDFSKKVISCMSAWSASDADLQAAASYFAGVCADFIPQNPGICTNVPSSITLSPVAAPTPQNNNNVGGGNGNGKGEVELPITSVQVIQTITVTEKGGEPRTSEVTSMITVPQVQFITATPTPAAAATPANGGGGEVVPVPAPTPSVALVAAQTPAAVLTTTAPVATTTAAGATTFAIGSTTFTYNAGTSGASGVNPSVTGPATFTGAGTKVDVGVGFGVLGALVAGVALVV